MATTKKITMREFNGTDYDTLYPKTVAAQIDDVYSKDETYSKNDVYTKSQVYNKTQTLADATKTLYGLSSSAVPDDVFKTIPLSNTGYIYVTTKTSAGIAVPGIPLLLDDIYLGKTKSDGTGRFSVPFGEHTIKIIKPIDCSSVSPTSVSISVVNTEIKTINVTCVLSTATNTTISTSGFYGFSDRVSDFDACVVGGGGSGAAASVGSSGEAGSGGGGGGYVVNQYNLSVQTFNCFSAIVGAGGESVTAQGNGSSYDFTSGNSGGASIITSQLTGTKIEALGGKGGVDGMHGGDGGDGGSGGGCGHGNGGSGAGGTDGGDGGSITTAFDGNALGGKGQGTTTRPFGDTSKTPLSPGGGGAACNDSGGGSAGTAQTNGSPGAYAKEADVSAVAGTIMGSGGGGAVTHRTIYTATSAKGIDGGILLRWRFKS